MVPGLFAEQRTERSLAKSVDFQAHSCATKRLGGLCSNLNEPKAIPDLKGLPYVMIARDHLSCESLLHFLTNGKNTLRSLKRLIANTLIDEQIQIVPSNNYRRSTMQYVICIEGKYIPAE